MSLAKLLKCVEVAGFKVELLLDYPGSTYRVNVSHSDGSFPRTRVFVDYDEACALFDSYLQGN